jgi:ligand-binding sensor domain-containing protein/signal transduction histidine kinase
MIYYLFGRQVLLNRSLVIYHSKLIIVFLISFGSFAVFSQSSGIRFNRITINQGLSLSSIYCIHQDSKGFMWFGTEDGLNKYDGKNFRIFRNIPGDTNSLSYKWTEIVYEDLSGMLWFGSKRGLTRFDPVNEIFCQYYADAKDPESLANDTITAVAEDTGNNLWIGTASGLNRIRTTTGAIERISVMENGINKIDSRINLLLPDNKGNLWIGSQSGLYYYDHETSLVSKIRLSENALDDFIIRALALNGEELWIGTDRGLGKLARGKDGTAYHFTNSTFENSHPRQVIENILFDGNGKLWVSTEAGLYMYDSSGGLFTLLIESLDASNSLAINTAKSLFLDSHGILWFGTQGSGLYRINTLDNQAINYRNNPADMRSLSENAINCIFEDRSGVLWIGTFGAGISILDPQANKFELLCHNPVNPESLSSNFIWSVIEASDGTIWIGTNDKGLNCYSPLSGDFTFYDHHANDPSSLSASTVKNVYQDSKGNIWVGTDGGGLDLLNRETGHFSHFRHNPADPSTLSGNSVRVIYEDDSGTLWIGTRDGLNKFDPGTKKFKRYVHSPEDTTSISHNFVYSVILKDSKGSLWVGTYGGGLNRMNIVNETFTHYINHPDDPASLSDDIVFSVYEDNLGMIWVGTNNGLNRLDPSTGTFVRYGSAQGLPNEVIYGILPDNSNHIWMSTNFGIFRMNLTDYSIINFNVNDGLQSNEFNGGSFHRGISGKHYWGGVYGLNIIEPEKIRPAKNQSNVVITKLVILGKEVNVNHSSFSGLKSSAHEKIVADGEDLYIIKNISYASKIILNYNQRFISFEFNALNHPPSQKMSYSYRMEDMEDDWNNSGDRNFVTYANMRPGTYVFRADATNKDGFASPDPAGLIITINPPFWGTWWFIMMEIAAIIALIIFIYRYLLKAHTNKLLMAQNQEIFAANQRLTESQRQLSELNATKDKFFSIIAHDLKNPFTSLLSISEMMSKSYNMLDEDDKISSLKSFHRSARRIYELLENLLTWSRSQTGRIEFKPADFNISYLAMKCLKLFVLPAEKKGITLHLNTKDNLVAHGDLEMINTVIRNLLDNAIKYSNSGGTVELDIKLEDGLIRVAVRDLGVGIPDDDLKGLFNLASQSVSHGTGGERGTGLGLIICKEFVEKNGGRLIVMSEPDKGSTFSFYLQAGKGKGPRRDVSDFL